MVAVTVDLKEATKTGETATAAAESRGLGADFRRMSLMTLRFSNKEPVRAHSIGRCVPPWPTLTNRFVKGLFDRFLFLPSFLGFFFYFFLAPLLLAPGLFRFLDRRVVPSLVTLRITFFLPVFFYLVS